MDYQDGEVEKAPTPPPASPTASKHDPTEEEEEEELELLYTEAGLRQLIGDRLPTAESPPNYVRLWLGGYFTYRGVDPGRADQFLWSGAEFMDLALEELVEGFRAKLGSGRDRDRGSSEAGGDDCKRKKGGGGGGGKCSNETETTAATGARYTRMVTETEVEMLALDVFNFIQSRKPWFWKRELARAGRLVSRQATMGQRLDAFLSIVAYLGLLLLVLAGLSGIWTYNGFSEVVGEKAQRYGIRMGQRIEKWLGPPDSLRRLLPPLHAYV
ncbi:uncharacterized protein PG986_014100 [Apiospora aurea]|uniref:Uncharacterized protein n=1 Tax=Apiospora aurea TaxID=335848 RepID=A0ABR1PS18_9PEZI